MAAKTPLLRVEKEKDSCLGHRKHRICKFEEWKLEKESLEGRRLVLYLWSHCQAKRRPVS